MSANETAFDSAGNIVEQTIDNLDGTGTHTDYRTDPPTVTELVDLPLPVVEPEPVEPIDPVIVGDFASGIIAADNMQAMKDAAQALLDALGGA